MMMLEPLVHNDTLCIAIKGKFSATLLSQIRTVNGCLYSATHRCFYFVYQPEKFSVLQSIIGTDGQTHHKWSEILRGDQKVKYLKPCIEIPARYTEELIKMRYSKATYENYIAQFRNFLVFIYPEKVSSINDSHIHRYLLHLANEKRVSISTQNQAINSIKFYLEHVEHGDRKVYYVERPRQETKLPIILSEEEIKSLIFQTHYIKHKCVLIMLYSAGLRLSELLNLKITDIDYARKMVMVRAGKGRNDRFTLLSEVAVEYLQHYIEVVKPRVFLFEGSDGAKYGASSVNMIIKRSAEKAGIKKRVSAHTLRHSFATHYSNTVLTCATYKRYWATKAVKRQSAMPRLHVRASRKL